MAQNHVPIPASEGVAAATAGQSQCDQLKHEFNIVTVKYGDRYKVPKPSPAHQAHHIFQSACLRGLVPHKEGWAVFLHGGSGIPKSQHDIINKRQNYRTRTVFKSKYPNPTYGQLKKWATIDLAKGLAKGKPKLGITTKNAKLLAECLVAEAEREHQANPKCKKMTENTPVRHAGKCFSGGTRLYVADRLIVIEALRVGDFVHTQRGLLPVLRVDECFDVVVVIQVDDECIGLTQDHRVRLADGGTLRASQLRVGHCLATIEGEGAKINAVTLGGAMRVFGFGVGAGVDCFVGRRGIQVEPGSDGPRVETQMLISGCIMSRSE